MKFQISKPAVILVVLLSFFTIILQADLNAQSAPPKLPIYYSGRMLGYYRIPSSQAQTDIACSDKDRSPAADKFMSALSEVEVDHRVLVAVGDNFAPHLLARTFAPVTTHFREEKDLYTWVGGHWKKNNEVTNAENVDLVAGRGSIPNDNVACFFRLAKFDAVVPGKHDFYFGPEHLRYLAHLMEKPRDGAQEPVKFLAANIAVTTRAADVVPIPDYVKSKDLPYITDPTPLAREILRIRPILNGAAGKNSPRFTSQLKADVPDAVLPWLRELVIRHWLDLYSEKGNLVNAADLDSVTVECSSTTCTAACNQPLAIDCAASLKVKTATSEKYVVRPNAGAAWLCRGPDPDYAENSRRDPDTLNAHPFDHCSQLSPVRQSSRTQSEKKEFTSDITLALPPLSADHSYLICFTAGTPPMTSLPSHQYCSGFSVRVPFLQYRHDANSAAGGSPVPSSAADIDIDGAYTIKTVCLQAAACSEQNRTEVAIFGVVDPDLKSYIGNLNYSWRNTQNRYQTDVDILDPVDSLKQVFQIFQEQRPDFHGQKILLAHMPRAKAAEIAFQMKGAFTAIITQADPEHFTEDGETLSRTITDSKQAGPRVYGPGFLLTPEYSYTSASGKDVDEKTFKVDINHADISIPIPVPTPIAVATASGPVPSIWSSTNHIKVAGAVSDRVTACAQGSSLLDLVEQVLVSLVGRENIVSWSQEQKYQRLVLEAMRGQAHADVALLQKHDFFETRVLLQERICEDNLQAAIDHILWKGDFLFPVAMKGSDLKKVMDRSAQYDSADRNALQFDLNHDRGLLALGIAKDAATKTYFINGSAVDDNRLYSVAVTDYAGLGDTGYPEFAVPVVPPAPRIKDLQTIYSVSGLVCEQIRTENSSVTANWCEPQSVDARAYFDEIDQKPFDTSRGYTAWRQFIKWGTPSLHPPSPYRSFDDLEIKAQQRPLFSIALEKADFNYQLNVHTDSEQQVATQFSGIPNAQLTAAESNTIGFDYRIQALKSRPKADLFALSEAYYARTNTRQPNAADSYLENQTLNLFAIEGGMRPRLWPRHKQIPALLGVLSLRYETQLLDPLTKFSLNTSPASTLIGTTDKTRYLLGKFGLRLQDEKSWIESGFQVGEKFASPVAFTFNPLLATQTTCNLRAGTSTGSFLDCIKTASTPPASGPALITAQSNFQPVTENKLVDGLFLNFHLTIPLPVPLKSAFAYSMDNRGEVFFNRSTDLSIDTKFSDLWSHSLIIPLYGNFSLVPKADIYFFQNKVDNNFFHSINTSLAFQYRFDWKRGLKWRDAFLYASPAAKP